MNDCSEGRSCRYRVWIVACSQGLPPRCSDVPPDAIALEPAEEGTLSAGQAARYVEAFNRAVLGARRRIWAVAIPVGVVGYEGEPCPGQPLSEAGGGFSLPVSRRCPPEPGRASTRARPPAARGPAL